MKRSIVVLVAIAAGVIGANLLTSASPASAGGTSAAAAAPYYYGPCTGSNTYINLSRGAYDPNTGWDPNKYTTSVEHFDPTVEGDWVESGRVTISFTETKSGDVVTAQTVSWTVPKGVVENAADYLYTWDPRGYHGDSLATGRRTYTLNTSNGRFRIAWFGACFSDPSYATPSSYGYGAAAMSTESTSQSAPAPSLAPPSPYGRAH